MQVLQALLQFHHSHTCETRAKHTSACSLDFEHEISGTRFEISPAVRKVPLKIDLQYFFECHNWFRLIQDCLKVPAGISQRNSKKLSIKKTFAYFQTIVNFTPAKFRVYFKPK